MKSTLRRIGNSRGIIIPAPLLAQCDIQDEVELTVDEGRLIIAPVKPLRSGWFDQYQPAVDEDAWKGLVETHQELEEWTW